MGSAGPRVRTTAALVVVALIALGTLSLRHACSDAHAGDRLSHDCLTCRTVGSSAVTLTEEPEASTHVAAYSELPLPGDDCARVVDIAAPSSRGPPSLV